MRRLFAQQRNAYRMDERHFWFILFPLSHTQFFSGWWFLIDAISVYGAISAAHIILGILGTISLIMVNSVTQAQVGPAIMDAEVDIEQWFHN